MTELEKEIILQFLKVQKKKLETNTFTQPVKLFLIHRKRGRNETRK